MSLLSFQNLLSPLKQVAKTVGTGVNYVQQGFMNIVGRGAVGWTAATAAEGLTYHAGKAVKNIDTTIARAITRNPFAGIQERNIGRIIKPVRRLIFPDNQVDEVAHDLFNSRVGDNLRAIADQDFGGTADLISKTLDPEYKTGAAWEDTAAAVGQAGTDITLSIGFGGLGKIPAALSLLSQAAIYSGSEAQQEYREQIAKGATREEAESRSARTYAQNLPLNIAAEVVDFLPVAGAFRPVSKLGVFSNIMKKAPGYIRVAAATAGGAVSEGIAEGLQGTIQRDIRRRADFDQNVDLIETGVSLLKNPEVQRTFLAEAAFGAVLGGAVRGGVRLATLSEPAVEGLTEAGFSDGYRMDLQDSVAELAPEERQRVMTVATYRAIEKKNQDLPAMVSYVAATRTGKAGTIDDVQRKIVAGKKHIEDREFGTIGLPTPREVINEVALAADTGRRRYEADSAVEQSAVDRFNQLQEQPMDIDATVEGAVGMSPREGGRFALADFNLFPARGERIESGDVERARQGGYQGVYSETGESMIFDDATVREVLGDRAVGDVREQHQREFRERIFEAVPTLREARVEYVDGLIDGKGLGAYLGRGEIRIAKGNENPTTLAHEGAHHFYEEYMDDNERGRAEKEIKRRYKAEVADQMKRHGIGEEEAVKEVFADKMADWVVADTRPTTFLEQLWEDFKNIIRELTGAGGELRKAYRQYRGGEARIRGVERDLVDAGMGENLRDRQREEFYRSGMTSPMVSFARSLPEGDLTSGEIGDAVGEGKTLLQRAQEEYAKGGFTTKMLEWLSERKGQTMKRQALLEVIESRKVFDKGALAKVEREMVREFLGWPAFAEKEDIPLGNIRDLLVENLDDLAVVESDSYARSGLEDLSDAMEYENEASMVVVSRGLADANVEGEHVFDAAPTTGFEGKASETYEASLGSLGWWRRFESEDFKKEGGKYFVSEVQSDSIPKLKGSMVIGQKEWYEKYKANYIHILLRHAAKDAISRGHGEMYLPTADTIGVIEGFGMVNEFTSPERLRELAEHSNYDVRWRVAEHPKTPKDVLTKMSYDENDRIVSSVAENPNTPVEILLELFEADISLTGDGLSRGVTYNVKKALARNPSTPRDVLEGLARHEDDSVAAEARSYLEDPTLHQYNAEVQGDISSAKQNILRQYTKGGRIYKAYGDVFGDLADYTDGAGNSWYRVDLSSGFDTPMRLYQREGEPELEPDEQEVVRNTADRLAEESGEVRKDDLEKELVKRLLLAQASEGVEVDGITHHPVYVSVGNTLDGKGTEDVVAGYWSMKEGKIVDFSVMRLVRTDGNRFVFHGDVMVDTGSPALYETIFDHMSAGLAGEGVGNVEIGDSVPKQWQARMRDYFGGNTVPTSTDKLITVPDGGVQKPLYKREEIDPELRDIMGEMHLTENDLPPRDKRRWILFGKQPKGKLENEGPGAIKRGFRSVFRNTPELLDGISPILYGRFQEMMHNQQIRATDNFKEVDIDSAKKKIKKMPKLVKTAFDIATKDNQIDRAKKIAEKYGFLETLDGARENLERIHDRLKQKGFGVPYRKDYLPRAMTDKAKKRLGEEDSAYDTLVSFSGEENLSVVASNLKRRKVERVDKMNHMDYESFVPAYTRYVRSVENVLAVADFFGDDAKFFKTGERKGQLNVMASIVSLRDRLIQEGVIKNLNTAIELEDTLKKVFRQRNPAWTQFVQGAGNLTYIQVMMDAVNVIRDAESLVYLSLRGQRGYRFRNVVRGAFDALVGVKGDRLTPKRMGLDSFRDDYYIGEERNKLQRLTEVLFRGSLRQNFNDIVRTIGNHTTVAEWRRALKQGNLAAFKEHSRIEDIIPGDQVSSVTEDIIQGRYDSYGVRLLFFENEGRAIMNSQQQNPPADNNLAVRMLKTLLSENIKALNITYDFYRKEAERGKLHAAKSIVILVTTLLLMGVPREAVIKLLKNQKIGVEDIPLLSADIMLRSVGSSTYSWKQAWQRKDVSGLVGDYIPVSQTTFVFVNTLISAASKFAKGDTQEAVDVILKRFPIVGPSYYAWLAPSNERDRKIYDSGLQLSGKKKSRGGFGSFGSFKSGSFGSFGSF